MTNPRLDAPSGSAPQTVPMEPVVSPSSPASLEGVKIEGCVFTETVARKEPRPPLYSAILEKCRHVTSGVYLAVEGGRVSINQFPRTCPACGRLGIPIQPGSAFPGAPQGPVYTDPITPAMWFWIRKWWTP